MSFCQTKLSIYLELSICLSDKVTVIKGLRIKVLHLELSYGGTVTNSLRFNLFYKVSYHG